MADPKLEYFTQANFSGGIATEPELRRVTKAGEVTVAEAADVWAPNAVLRRRPGVSGVVVPNIISTFSTSVQVASTMQAVFISNGGAVVYSAYDAGGGGNPELVYLDTADSGVVYIKLQSTSDGVGQVGMDWPTPVTAFTNLSSVGENPNLFWVPDGGSVVTDRQVVASAVIEPYLVFATSNPATGSLWAAYTVVPAGASFNIYNSFNNPSCVATKIGNGESVYGIHYAPLPTENSYLSLYHYNLLGVNRLYLQKCLSLGADSAYGTVLGTSYVIPDPALYTQTGSPPSWATVVDANRVYVCYANQVYEYRPELSTPFRLAQVNSDPLLVGPGATYDPTTFAQNAQYPLANQCIYFNGLMFFTDIKDNPNIVQWSGPAIDGAVDILPALSYAILTDSRDNSKNMGFGVYNSNLYVFKQNSIWSMIPSGQSSVDGTYQFTTRLVTSGAGCSAPGSIVSTPDGIIFYNAGGFYIFDGQSTRKLTSQCKSLFDAIVPGNAYQMQACHWAQQHSYVVSVQMSHPWPNEVFTDLPQIFTACLGYDYQNEAWWLWLSVTEQGILVDGSQQVVTQATSAAWRILDPKKQFDSDALAKSTATPYIKTQRFGFGNSIQHRFEEMRVTGEIDNLSNDVEVTINDQILAADDQTLSYLPPDIATVDINTTILDGDDYSPPWGRYEARIPVNLAGKWAQATLQGSYGPFTIYNLNLGYYFDGRNG